MFSKHLRVYFMLQRDTILSHYDGSESGEGNKTDHFGVSKSKLSPGNFCFKL